MRFERWDIVKISRESCWYGENRVDNPADIEGEIYEEVIPDRSIRVKWSHNGETNMYDESDLRLVRRQE